MAVPGPAARLIVAGLPRPGESARLDAGEAAHARARRLEPGDRVILIDGTGRLAEGVMRRGARGALEVRVDSWLEQPLPGPAVTLLVCGVRPERLDWIAEKATELGAHRVVLVSSERAQAFRAAAGRLTRLEKVVRAAAKQCGRATWPLVAGPSAFDEALEEPAIHRILLDAAGEPFPAALAAGPSALLVGPEGGWSERERRLSRERGWSPARLPGETLRSETAAVAGLVLLQAALGRGR